MLVSLIESKVNSLQMFQKSEKIRSRWQGGAREGHRSARGRSILPVIAREQGVIASLYVVASLSVVAGKI